MSTAVETLRRLQMDRRLVANKIGEINSEMKTHPARTDGSASEEDKSAWVLIKKNLERKKAVLKQRLLDLESEQDALQLTLNQTPLTRASLGHVIAGLTEIEMKFTAETADDAWDALTAFIDWLERENNRVNIEEQIAKLEVAA